MNFKNIKECWENIIITLENEFDSKDFYETHFKKIVILKNIGQEIFFLCPNSLTKKIVISDFSNIISQKFLDILNINYTCYFLIEGDDLSNNNPKILEFHDALSSNMNFNNYIIGDFNNGIQKIREKINNNEREFSPFFIFGTTGIGKTHAINALGNDFKKNFPLSKVFYITAEDFTSESYNALSKGGVSIELYKNNFVGIDFLIVDDIQFLSNKNKLNEIFFTVFNKIHEKNGIIVLASDKPPNDLKIDERMSSRFRSGLIMNIKNPDSSALMEIIYSYGNKHKLSFTNDAITFLVNRYGGDIRIMIGTLKKLTFNISKDENSGLISKDWIEKMLGDEIAHGLLSTGYNINPNIIIQSISAMYGVDKESIISKSRKREYKKVRDLCIYVIREKLKIPYANIGLIFSNRSHSTIMESYKMSEKQIEESPEYAEYVENIIKNI